MSKPDPELLPIGRPRCPKCTTRMITEAVSAGPDGFEHRTFECLKCGNTEEKVVASDPLKSSAIGWLQGELGRTGPCNDD
jgi:hypothetical protein